MSESHSALRALSAPLEGVRVLDVTRFLAGPYAGWILAELGADVIKVEDCDRPDEARGVGPYFVGEQSLYFAALNSGKRSVAVRLGSPRGREIVLELARHADVVLDNNKPGVMAKLGLGEETLASVNPLLVSCSLSGFGTTGPLRDRPGYDYTMQAISGVMSVTGEPDGPPGKAGISYVDHAGGLTAALATCAALVKRYRDGVGGHVELALYDIQMSMLSYLAAWQLNAGYQGERTASAAHPSLIPAQNFQTADGHVSVFVGNDGMWSRLAGQLADPFLADERFTTLAGRQAHRAEVLARLRDVLLTRSTAEWVALLNQVGVPVAPINTVAQALQEPQTCARGIIQAAEHPRYGRYEYVGGPLPSLRAGPLDPAPLLGEHSRDVLLGVGLSEDQVDELIAAGHVISTDVALASVDSDSTDASKC